MGLPTHRPVYRLCLLLGILSLPFPNIDLIPVSLVDVVVDVDPPSFYAEIAVLGGAVQLTESLCAHSRVRLEVHEVTRHHGSLHSLHGK